MAQSFSVFKKRLAVRDRACLLVEMHKFEGSLDTQGLAKAHCDDEKDLWKDGMAVLVKYNKLPHRTLIIHPSS